MHKLSIKLYRINAFDTNCMLDLAFDVVFSFAQFQSVFVTDVLSFVYIDMFIISLSRNR